MVTAFVFVVVIDVNSFFSIVFLVFIFSNVLVVFIIARLEASFRLMFSRLIVILTALINLSSEASPRLAHLIEQIIAFFAAIFIVIENLFIFSFFLFVYQVINHLLIFLTTLDFLEVVLIQLVFKVVDVCELLYIDTVESFKLSFESLILFLVLGLDVLDTLEALLSSLEFDLPSLDLVVELALILTELLHSVLHLLHLSCLLVNDVTDALLDVLLLSISIKVSADTVKELKSFVS